MAAISGFPRSIPINSLRRAVHCLSPLALYMSLNMRQMKLLLNGSAAWLADRHTPPNHPARRSLGAAFILSDPQDIVTHDDNAHLT